MMQASPVILLSPSFNSYSNTKLAEIAARVVGEFGSDELFDNDFYFVREENSATTQNQEEKNSEYMERERENRVHRDEDEDEDEDEEFEFAFVNRETELSPPISADEIFQNGQIRPVYPVFGVEFQRENGKEEKGLENSDSKKTPKIRLPLRKLFIEERETEMATSSYSSSEADELDGVPSDSYCVWRPKEAAEEEWRSKKSSSTGAISKRCKFKDLLHRSQSDGSKDNFVFLVPRNNGRKKQNEESAKKTPGKVKSAAAPPPPALPVYNRDGGQKRRSYLPYRQDLVGFFPNVNGMNKILKPF